MNWKALIAIIQIANEARTRLRVIQIIIEILRQFDRSLAKIDGQPNGTETGSAGFVYVIRDKVNGERFKTGYRAQPPWRNSQLRAEMGESGDFVLIIPAKNAKTLETRLRRSYARGSRRGAWFTLDENKRREILIIAALVMVAAGDALGMSPVDEDIVKLAKNLLTNLKELATAMWANTASARTQSSEEDGPRQNEPDFDGFSEMSDFDWNWESVMDEDYRALPKLKGKDAYVTFIRDNSASQGKVFLDSHPVKSIEAAFLERSLGFPLEIALVLKVDNKKKARAKLLSPNEQTNVTEWVNLSDEELGEIKKVAFRDWKHGSVYVSPKSHWGLETLSARAYRKYPKLKEPAGYVCIVQGVKRGQQYKIWRTEKLEDSGGLFGMSGQLNNPHDALHSPKPVKFRCIIRSKYAKPFEAFLKERYSPFRRKGDIFKLDDWYKLDAAQLQEIRSISE